jgi:hypothetical protein
MAAKTAKPRSVEKSASQTTAKASVKSLADRPLASLAQQLESLPDDPDWPADGASQHDHYLFGSAKRR